MRTRLGLPRKGTSRSPANSWTWTHTSPLFSPDYFQTVLRSRSAPSAPVPVATQADVLPDAAITRSDGWHIYPREDMERQWQDVRNVAMAFAAAKPMDSLNSFDEL